MTVLKTLSDAEIEHGFSAVQIILLMEIAKAQDIYSYPLPEEETITDEEYIRAMQDLLARSFVENTGGTGLAAFRLTAKATDLFAPMFRSARVLEVMSAWEGTIPALIYRGEGPVCTLTRWDSESGYIGVSRLDGPRLGEWMEESGFLPGHPFADIREAENILKYDEQTRGNRDRVLADFIVHPEAPPSLWALQENVRCAVRSLAVSTGSFGLYVFLETDTESWIITNAETGSTDMDGMENAPDSDVLRGLRMLPDSIEYRENIWRKLL